MSWTYSKSRRLFLRDSAAGLILAGSRLVRAGGHDPSPHRIIDGRIIIGDFVKTGESAVVGNGIYQGVELQVDLPENQHIRNFGAPQDGLGLCVFASMTMAAKWHNVRGLSDLMYWDEDDKGKPRPHSKIPKGGGWPEKVDATFKSYAPDVPYVQYEGTDPSILDKAMRSGRMTCVTYGYGERYGMQTIYHMVCLAHLDEKYAAVLDNNYPGTYEWMSRNEFLKRWVHPSGKGWAYVMLCPPPPPVPFVPVGARR